MAIGLYDGNTVLTCTCNVGVPCYWLFWVSFRVVSTILPGSYCYCLRGGIPHGVPYTETCIDLLCFSIWVLIIPDSSTRALWQSYQQSHLETSRRNMWKEWWNFPCEVFLFILASDFVTCCKISTWSRRFYSPPKECLLRIFFAFG
jgi:hypothetical protein